MQGKRRRFVIGALGVTSVLAAAAAWRFWPEPAPAAVLAAIREHNPLLFDFVLKRHLRAGNRRFPAGVFETRTFFAK